MKLLYEKQNKLIYRNAQNNQCYLYHIAPFGHEYELIMQLNLIETAKSVPAL